MLSITQRMGENIKINNDIEVKLLAIKGNQVKFGISAPKNVSVYRSEIYERIPKIKTSKAAS